MNLNPSPSLTSTNEPQLPLTNPNLPKPPNYLNLRYLLNENRNEVVCCFLPIAVGILALFIVLQSERGALVWKRDIFDGITSYVEDNANYAFDSTKTIGSKNLFDVASIGDFWSWV